VMGGGGAGANACPCNCLESSGGTNCLRDPWKSSVPRVMAMWSKVGIVWSLVSSPGTNMAWAHGCFPVRGSRLRVVIIHGPNSEKRSARTVGSSSSWRGLRRSTEDGAWTQYKYTIYIGILENMCLYICRCFLHRQDIGWSRSRVPILRWSGEL
jgi:hypothetical protein